MNNGEDQMEDQVAAEQVEAKGKTPMMELPAFKNNPALPNPGKLISRLDHAVTIAYNGEGLVIPPRAQGKNAILVADKAKLGALPSGVECIKA